MIDTAAEAGRDDCPPTPVGGEVVGVGTVEQRSRKLLDHTPDAICVHQDGRVVYVNPAATRRMKAHSPKQIIGNLITDFVHPNSIPAMLARIGLLRNEGDATAPSEAVIVALDATTIDAELISVLTRWDGRPAYQVVFRDLTAQKAAHAALHYQAALISHVSDAIIASAASGIVNSWNPAAETIYGRLAADALALPISEAVGAPLDPQAIVAAGGVTHTTHRDANGMALAVRVSAAAMDSGYVLVCSDLTALHRAERRFHTVVDSLDKGVVVVRADGQVELANRAATRILGIAENDVRTRYADWAMNFRCYDEHGEVNVRFDDNMGEIILNCDEGRIRRPLLVVKEGHLVLSRKHIEDLKLGRLRFSDLVRNGVVEWVDAEEEEDTFIAVYPYDVPARCKECKHPLSRNDVTWVNMGSRDEENELECKFCRKTFRVKGYITKETTHLEVD